MCLARTDKCTNEHKLLSFWFCFFLPLFFLYGTWARTCHSFLSIGNSHGKHTILGYSRWNKRTICLSILSIWPVQVDSSTEGCSAFSLDFSTADVADHLLNDSCKLESCLTVCTLSILQDSFIFLSYNLLSLCQSWFDASYDHHRHQKQSHNYGLTSTSDLSLIWVRGHTWEGQLVQEWVRQKKIAWKDEADRRWWRRRKEKEALENGTIAEQKCVCVLTVFELSLCASLSSSQAIEWNR